MSLAGFATLQAKHPGDPTVQAIERFLSDLLRRYPEGLVDDRAVADGLDLTRSAVAPYLVDLVDAGALDTHFSWICPNGGGVADEQDDLAKFADEVECQCGKVHSYSEDDIEVAFLPTEVLRSSASEHGTP